MPQRERERGRDGSPRGRLTFLFVALDRRHSEGDGWTYQGAADRPGRLRGFRHPTPPVARSGLSETTWHLKRVSVALLYSSFHFSGLSDASCHLGQDAFSPVHSHRFALLILSDGFVFVFFLYISFLLLHIIINSPQKNVTEAKKQNKKKCLCEVAFYGLNYLLNCVFVIAIRYFV